MAIRLQAAAFAWPKAKTNEDAKKQTTDAQDAAADAARIAEEAQAPLTLGPLELAVRAGELIGVVGPVGSGKSSLLWSDYTVPEDCAGWITSFARVAETFPA